MIGEANSFERKLPDASTIVRSKKLRRCAECKTWIRKDTWHLSHRRDVIFDDDGRRPTHIECIESDANLNSIMSLIYAALRDHDLEILRRALVKQNRDR
jgi:hypothetical protein